MTLPADPDATALILAAHAHLLAGLESRIDAGAPALVDALADLLLPHVLRSAPAATIVAFTPNLTALRARQRLAPHRPLVARAREGTACRFRTCGDLDLHPIDLLSATLDDRLAAHPQIRLTLRARESFADAGRLRFYLHHAQSALPATLMLWLCRHCTGVRVDADGHPPVHLPPAALDPVGLRPDALALLPWPDTAPPAHRLLLERFILPERAHFIDVVGLHAAAPPVAELTLTLLFDRPPPLPAPLSTSVFRLHCAPAVNLFEATAEPLRHGPHAREHLLRADGVDPRHMEVHAVVRVAGQARAHGGVRRYAPLHDLSPEPGAPRFAIRRAPAADGGVDTWLAPRDAPGVPAADDEILSVDLLCTNRNLAGGLGPGDLGDASAAHALIRGYTNLTAVSPPVRAPAGDEAAWHLAAHLGLAARVHDVAALRALLHLLNAPARLHGPLGRSNARQIDAVRTLDRDLLARVHRGAPVRTIRTRLDLDEAAFPSPGHAFLFAALLDPLFAAAAPFLGASELHVTLNPSAAELPFPPRLAP